MKDNPVAKNAHKFNKSQVMKDRKKAMKKGERKHKGKMDEKLSAKDDAGEWVKDFRKSDAPQFKGKSDKKKQQMAIAAYLDAKREKREAMEEKKGLWANIHAKRKRGERPAKPGEKGYPKTLDIEEDEDPCWKGYKQLGMKKKGGKQVPNCVPESAQDRLNKRAAKLGIGNRNKAADDYMARMKAKHGEQGVKDRLASNQAKIDAIKKARQRREGVNEELTPVQKRKYMNLKKRAKAGNSQAKIRLKSFEKEFAKELDMERGSAAKTKKAVRGKGAADPHSGQAYSGFGGGSGDDKNIVTQLRKAQDMGGKMDIELARGKKVRAPKSLIDKILGRFDQLQKPQDKKKFMDLVTKELMKKAK